MIPYNKNQFTFGALIKSIFIRNSDSKLEDFFREYTGKKYILITNSCRSALYLTYKALDDKGEIITSPLTCKVAIDPIFAAGYEPVFQDIDKDLLTMSTVDLEKRITNNTRGIQVTHLGGIPCDLLNIRQIVQVNKLLLIEDCAQGLFSEINGTKAGTVGDYICFSLIKNAKGIGGGILATNDEEVYRKARSIQDGFKKTPIKLVLFRILRSLLENKKDLFLVNGFHYLLLKFRNLDKTWKDDKSRPYYSLNLYQPSKIESRISVIQLKKSLALMDKRLIKGKLFFEMLQQSKLAENYSDLTSIKPSFVKLLLYSKTIDSRVDIKSLNKIGIEAMHLEHKYKTFYQERFDKSMPGHNGTLVNLCNNYLNVHDHIISLPFYENLSESKMKRIIQSLKCIENKAR